MSQARIDHKLANLVGMLNRSSDWAAIPEIVMLTFIEATDLFREQAKAIKELQVEVEHLKKGRPGLQSAQSESSLGGRASTAGSGMTSVLDQLAELQHHHHNRHRRSRSRMDVVNSNNSANDREDDEGSVEGAGGEAGGGTAEPSPAATPPSLAPQAEPERIIKSSLSPKRDSAQKSPKRGVMFAEDPDPATVLVGPPDEAAQSPKKPAKKGVKFASEDETETPPGGVLPPPEPATSPVQKAPKKGVVFAEEPEVHELARRDSTDSVIVLAEEEAPNDGTAAPAEAGGTGDASGGHTRAPSVKAMAAAFEEAAGVQKKGVRFAAQEDVRVFSIRLEDFHYESAFRKLTAENPEETSPRAPSLGSTPVPEVGLRDKGARRHSRSEMKELVFVFDNEDESPSPNGGSSPETGAQLGEGGGAAEQAMDPAGAEKAATARERKIHESMQLTDLDSVELLFDLAEGDEDHGVLSRMDSEQGSLAGGSQSAQSTAEGGGAGGPVQQVSPNPGRLRRLLRRSAPSGLEGGGEEKSDGSKGGKTKDKHKRRLLKVFIRKRRTDGPLDNEDTQSEMSEVSQAGGDSDEQQITPDLAKLIKALARG